MNMNTAASTYRARGGSIMHAICDCYELATVRVADIGVHVMKFTGSRDNVSLSELERKKRADLIDAQFMHHMQHRGCSIK